QGLFELKDAVIIIAGMLNISRHTVYLHLRNFKNKSHSS
ncbi:helix-turn-helix domain-containing protein, partial [Salmonella enterica]